MSYRKKTKRQHYVPQHRNSLPSRKPFKIKTTEIDATKLFGKWTLGTREKEKKEEISEVPDAVEKTNKTILDIDAGNQAGNIGISGTKENTERMNFTNQDSRTLKRDKRCSYV